MTKTTLKKNYWTQETEDAIIAYNNEQDMDKRNDIFNNHIYSPLCKLVECVFNTRKITNMDMTNRDAILDTVSFLTENLHRFVPSPSHKAFSYFSVITKNRLFEVSNRNYKNWKRCISINNSGSKADDLDKSNEYMETLLQTKALPDQGSTPDEHIEFYSKQKQRWNDIYSWYANEEPKIFRSANRKQRTNVVLEEIDKLLKGEKQWLSNPSQPGIKSTVLSVYSGTPYEQTVARTRGVTSVTNPVFNKYFNRPRVSIKNENGSFKLYQDVTRTCPECNKAIIHKGQHAADAAKYALKRHQLCRSCSKKKPVKIHPEYNRNCPECNETMTYTGRNAKYALTDKSVCCKCARKNSLK